MQKAIRGYLIQSLIISGVLAFSYFILYNFGFPQLYTSAVYVLIAILFLINLVFHSFFVRTIIKNNEAFGRRFLASTMLKLLIYLSIILIMIFIRMELIRVLLVSFLVCYLVFTAHEIYSIMEFLKKNSSQHVKSK